MFLSAAPLVSALPSLLIQHHCLFAFHSSCTLTPVGFNHFMICTCALTFDSRSSGWLAHLQPRRTFANFAVNLTRRSFFTAISFTPLWTALLKPRLHYAFFSRAFHPCLQVFLDVGFAFYRFLHDIVFCVTSFFVCCQYLALPWFRFYVLYQLRTGHHRDVSSLWIPNFDAPVNYLRGTQLSKIWYNCLAHAASIAPMINLLRYMTLFIASHWRLSFISFILSFIRSFN